MNRYELMKHIGRVEQIGGVKDFVLNDGKGSGVRVIEIDTGNLSFCILPSRGMDIAQAKYKGIALSWISKTGIVAPQYYEKDGSNWLRSFTGGLITTCGLKNIGSPTENQGLHGRIANVPADRVSIYASWKDDEYIMRVSGEVRETAAFGENLVLRRTITAKLFSDKITVEDTIVNEGFKDEDIALCYHCNFGFPLVKEGARIVNVPKEISCISAPTHGQREECIPVTYSERIVTSGIENDELGAYITYDRGTLPDFLIWKMLGESEYVVGLEPRTTSLGGKKIIENKKFVVIKPFEEFKTKLCFEIKEKNRNK